MAVSRRPGTDPISIKACDFTGRWMRKHGLKASEVSIFQGMENGKPIDVLLVDTLQLAQLDDIDDLISVPDLLGIKHLVYLSIPSDG